MIVTPHALAGFFISANVERLRLRNGRWSKRLNLAALTCLLSFLSHFLLDSVPHYDYPLSETRLGGLIGDLISLGFISGIVFWKYLKIVSQGLRYPIGMLHYKKAKIKLRFLPLFFTMAASAVSSMMPDILLRLDKSLGLNYLPWFSSIHKWSHAHNALYIETGLYAQLVLSILMSYMIYRSMNKLEMESSFEEAEAWLSEEVQERQERQ